MALADCLKKHGLDEATVAQIVRRSQELAKEYPGTSIEDAQRTAGKEHLAELRARVREIEQRVWPEENGSGQERPEG